jgi:hypothetical protein
LEEGLAWLRQDSGAGRQLQQKKAAVRSEGAGEEEKTPKALQEFTVVLD